MGNRGERNNTILILAEMMRWSRDNPELTIGQMFYALMRKNVLGKPWGKNPGWLREVTNEVFSEAVDKAIVAETAENPSDKYVIQEMNGKKIIKWT